MRKSARRSRSRRSCSASVIGPASGYRPSTGSFTSGRKPSALAVLRISTSRSCTSKSLAAKVFAYQANIPSSVSGGKRVERLVVSTHFAAPISRMASVREPRPSA